MSVRRTKEAEQRIAEFPAANKCLGCERTIVKGERITRGLCSTCYQGMLHAKRKGRVTEATLIKEGRLLPATGGGRKPANKFTRELLGR